MKVDVAKCGYDYRDWLRGVEIRSQLTRAAERRMRSISSTFCSKTQLTMSWYGSKSHRAGGGTVTPPSCRHFFGFILYSPGGGTIAMPKLHLHRSTMLYIALHCIAVNAFSSRESITKQKSSEGHTKVMFTSSKRVCEMHQPTPKQMQQKLL